MNFFSFHNFHFPLGNNVKLSILLQVCLFGEDSLSPLLQWQDASRESGNENIDDPAAKRISHQRSRSKHFKEKFFRLSLEVR